MKFFPLYKDDGKVQLIILFVVITLSLFLTGGLFSQRRQPSQQQAGTPTQIGGTCCDKGDGNNCTPYTEEGRTFTFNGNEYGLLKSSVKFQEGNYHLKDSGKTFQNHPIIINASEGFFRRDGYQYIECGYNEKKDQIFSSYPKPGTPIQDYCVAIPNDQIVYVCKENCTSCSVPPNPLYDNLFCYGNANSVYDVYFKLGDDVPDVIRNCDKETFAGPYSPAGPIIIPPTGTTGGKNLHINSFKIVEITPVQGSIPWLSPYCKPAIYLYPEQKTDVTVHIAPLGKLTYTIPPYPKDGWLVTAYPSGLIKHQNASYPYLYYEAEIPDESYTVPEKGFVVPFDKLSKQLYSLLPNLGLNKNETSEFVFYWTKVLPESAYYFIGIIPAQTLDTIAPLSISPKPDKVIRVTLYFEALDAFQNVSEPIITTSKRNGFTVVEWGGIFKNNKNLPFSCLM